MRTPDTDTGWVPSPDGHSAQRRLRLISLAADSDGRWRVTDVSGLTLRDRTVGKVDSRAATLQLAQREAEREALAMLDGDAALLRDHPLASPVAAIR